MCQTINLIFLPPSLLLLFFSSTGRFVDSQDKGMGRRTQQSFLVWWGMQVSKGCFRQGNLDESSLHTLIIFWIKDQRKICSQMRKQNHLIRSFNKYYTLPFSMHDTLMLYTLSFILVTPQWSLNQLHSAQVPLLAMLEEYRMLRKEKEEEKLRLRVSIVCMT